MANVPRWDGAEAAPVESLQDMRVRVTNAMLQNRARQLREERAAAPAPATCRAVLRGQLWRALQAFLLASYVETIRKLACWAPRVRATPIDLLPYDDTPGGVDGNYSTSRRRVTVYAHGHLAYDLSTILHELAHSEQAWMRREPHDEPWARAYVNASNELTGRDDTIPRLGRSDASRSWKCDQVVIQAMGMWLHYTRKNA